MTGIIIFMEFYQDAAVPPDRWFYIQLVIIFLGFKANKLNL